MTHPIPPGDEDLETFINRNLGALPEMSAPPTLVHRVMLAVHAQDRLGWWQRSWWCWPVWPEIDVLRVAGFRVIDEGQPADDEIPDFVAMKQVQHVLEVGDRLHARRSAEALAAVTFSTSSRSAM